MEGYDPSGNDFFANVPERTVLLRIRADLDNDGIEDLALSESSTCAMPADRFPFEPTSPAPQTPQTALAFTPLLDDVFDRPSGRLLE